MKHILILSFYYTPDLSAGSFRTAALIESLKKMQLTDTHFDLLTTMPNRYHHFKANADAHEVQDNINIYRITLPKHQNGFIDQAKAFVQYFLMVRRFLKKNKHKKYCCVYATTSRLFTAFLGARSAAMLHCPLFLDIRDIFTETISDVLKTPLRQLLSPLFNAVERYTIRKAAVINLVSPGFTAYFLPKIKKNCALLNVSNGVDACFKELASTEIRPLQKPTRVLYAGNIGEGQGIEKIIPQLAQSVEQNCIFRIIGSGGKLAALKTACESIRNVEIVEPMSRTQLIHEYAQADILFLHLNNYPAFLRVLPSKIFEYSMTGKPILSGVPGYAAQFLKEQVAACEIFSPCDAKMGLEKLHYLITHYNRMEKRDTHAFYEKFNREKLMDIIAKKIIAISQRANEIEYSLKKTIQ